MGTNGFRVRMAFIGVPRKLTMWAEQHRRRQWWMEGSGISGPWCRKSKSAPWHTHTRESQSLSESA